MQTALALPGFEPPRAIVAPTVDVPPWTKRAYQLEAVANVFDLLKTHRSTLLVMATGTGKTRTAGSGIIARWLREERGRVLWLCHLDTLIEQTRRELQAQLGQYIGLEQGNSRWSAEMVCVGSVCTLYRQERLDYVRRRPTLLIYDEAHHSMSAANKKIVDAIPEAKLVGLTATPARFDGVGLKGLYESVALEYGIELAIPDGYLVPVLMDVAQIKGLDFSKLSKKEFQSDEKLATVIGMDDVLLGIVTATMERIGNRQTVMFFPTVNVAHLAAQVFNSIRPGCAVAVDGTKMDKHEKRARIAAFKKGEYQVICNVGVLAEGADIPNIQAVGGAAPTESVSRFLQMLGRGARNTCKVDDYATPEERRAAIAASDKPNLLYIDYVGNSGKHNPVMALDVLAGKDWNDPGVMRKAKEAAKSGRMSAEDAIKKGREALQRERAAEAARVSSSQAVKFEFRRFNPFEAFGVKHEGFSTVSNALNRPSVEQVRQLAYFGIDDSRGMSATDAQALIRNAKMRQAKGLTSYKQIRTLEKFGIKAKQMYRKTATNIIEHMVNQAKIANRRDWRHPGNDELARIIRESQREPGED